MFDPFAAVSDAAGQIDSEAANSATVKMLISSMPADTLKIGRDKGNPNMPGTIEQVLGYNKATGEVRVVGDEELESIVHLKHGIMTKKNLTAGALLMIVQALNKVPKNQCPAIMLAIVFAMLQLSLKGFTALSIMQQAAVAVLFIPSPSAFSSLCDVAEMIEQIDLTETLQPLDHVCCSHDEGSDKLKQNKMLLYLIMLVFGEIQRRCIASLQPGKQGNSNVAAMVGRLVALGLVSVVECEQKGSVTPPRSCGAGCTHMHGFQVHVRLTAQTVGPLSPKV